MTIKTSRRNLAPASADEAATPHAMPAQAGKGILARRHLYMSAAVVALMVAGGAGGVHSAKADGIDNTTPTNISVGDLLGDLGTILNNRPRASGHGEDILTAPGDKAGVDVQVKVKPPIVSAIDSVGDIDVNVGDVDARYSGQKGVNATNASGIIDIDASDIYSDAMGVNA